MIQPFDVLVVLAFLWLIAAVYILAIKYVAELVLARWQPGAFSPMPPRRLVIRRTVFVLALAGLGCFAYGYAWEPYWPQVVTVPLTSAKLPPGHRPIRLVHISDLHCDPIVRLEERLPALIAAQRPDAILFTGDTLNVPAGLPIARRLLTRLAAIAPTIAVKGNWDVWFWSHLDRFGGTGAREVDGGGVSLRVGEQELWIAGAAPDDDRKIDQALSGVPPEAFVVFLHHYPDHILDVAKHPVDLYCAGHTHGGQVALPFYGALVTFSRFGKRFEAGLYRVQHTWLYVNRGIGMEGGLAPRVRFCARPEITVIEIRPPA